MSHIISINDIDISPIPDKQYWFCERHWREEFIYHLLVDRFHDNQVRHSVIGSHRSIGGGTPQQLQTFCGGTLQGITNNLDYIKNLGCTALLVSPIFENNPDCYHGYAIQNYLAVDPHFGTKEDFIELVNEAHQRDLKVFLDIVLNHSGDNWEYATNPSPKYVSDRRYLMGNWNAGGHRYPFGRWKYPDRPLPIELRNPDYYNRMGQIQNWEDPRETQYGDLCNLKDFRNDESQEGLEVQQIMIKIYCYWIRETDIDGFRLDAVKHIHPTTISRFCTQIREYTDFIGKRNFFMFGELIALDERRCDPYIIPNYSIASKTNEIFCGLDTIFDFFLQYKLTNTIKGVRSPEKLFSRYESFWENLLKRGKFGDYLITFIDSHDQLGQVNFKQRFAADAQDSQVIAAVGFLLCAIGVPCIYYGTEQGFNGHSSDPSYGDRFIREAMFDLDNTRQNFMNQQCEIYQEISRIAHLRQQLPALKFGQMYFREISSDGYSFGLPNKHPCILAFSRILVEQEVLFAYNTSTEQEYHYYVMISNKLNHVGEKFKFLYGGEGEIEIQKHQDQCNHSLFIQLHFQPMQMVILTKV